MRPHSQLRKWLVVFLLLMISGISMAIPPVQRINAAGNLCIRVNQPPNFDQLNSPPLSTLYQINLQTQAITKGMNLEGMPPKALAPNGQSAVYWKALGGTTNPAPMGMHLYSAKTQKSILLTTLNSMALSDLDRTWDNMPDFDWASPWRWSPDSQYLAYVGYPSAEKLDDPSLAVITPGGIKREVDLSPLPQKPQRIVIHGWSADNHYLAFSVTYVSPNPSKALWVWNAADEAAPLTNVEIPYDVQRGMGIWTPTGHQLVVLNRSIDSRGDQLTLWSPEKGILSQVPWYVRYGFLYWLAWSPDGKQLVSRDFDLESAEYDLIYGYRDDRLFNATDKITRTLFSADDGDANYAHTLLVKAWFDNGDALLSYADHINYRNDLVRLNLTTNVDEVLQSNVKSVDPSPDGRSTLFSYELNGKDSVDMLDTSGARKHFLTLDASPFGPYVLWSGDSRYVAFLGRDGETVLPKTLIVSADGGRKWIIMGADFFWIEKDWLVYSKIVGDEQSVQLLNLATNQTFDLGKINLEAPIPYTSLSPDEKKIVFRSGQNELTVNFLEDGHSQTLAADQFQIPDPIPGFYNGHQRYYDYDRSPAWLKENFAWSPDSSQFAYWGFEADKNETKYMLRVLAIDHGQSKQPDTYALANGYGETFSLSWSPCQ